MAGRYEAGWRSYEACIDFTTHFQRVGFAQPLWLGETDIAGKTILVHAEQGLGDTLQFCRYIPLLERAGARVLFAPQQPLKGLMRSLSSSVRIVDVDDATLEFDVHCRLLSLCPWPSELAWKPSLHRRPILVPNPNVRRFGNGT
jgi:hypothetical protein